MSRRLPPMTKVTWRIPMEDVDLLVALAEASGRDTNALVREVLGAYCGKVRERLEGQRGVADCK